MMATDPAPLTPPAPKGMPGTVVPMAPLPPDEAGTSDAPPAQTASPAQSPTAHGCFKVDIKLNGIQVLYDAECDAQITQEQLELLAQIRKAEAALKAIFFPDGLPSDLRLQNPTERWTKAASRKIASGTPPV